MSKYPLLSNYVSEIDQFLQAFDKQNPEPSVAQKKEIKKYQRVYSLRDDATRVEKPSSLWEKF